MTSSSYQVSNLEKKGVYTSVHPPTLVISRVCLTGTPCYLIVVVTRRALQPIAFLRRQPVMLEVHNLRNSGLKIPHGLQAQQERWFQRTTI
jgi:hypothetical protein